MKMKLTDAHWLSNPDPKTLPLLGLFFYDKPFNGKANGVIGLWERGASQFSEFIWTSSNDSRLKLEFVAEPGGVLDLLYKIEEVKNNKAYKGLLFLADPRDPEDWLGPFYGIKPCSKSNILPTIELV
jgi:hypothetical protein